jgi:hypothetical protein
MVQFAQGDVSGTANRRQIVGVIHFSSMCSSNRSGSGSGLGLGLGLGLGKRTVLTMDQATSQCSMWFKGMFQGSNSLMVELFGV